MPKSPFLRKQKKNRPTRDSPLPVVENYSVSPDRMRYSSHNSEDEHFCSDCSINGTEKLRGLVQKISPFSPSNACNDLCKYTTFFKNILEGDQLPSISQLKTDPTFVVEAIHNQQFPILHLLVEYGFTTSGRSLVSGATALIAAGQFYEITDMLLAKDSDPNEFDLHYCTPLMYAVRENDTALVRLLLRYGASTKVPPKPEKSLEIPPCVCKCGAVQKGTPILEDAYENPIILSIRKKNVELLKLLMEYKPYTLHSVVNGYSALIEAVKYRADQIIDVLLDMPDVVSGINDVCGSGLKTALSMACKHGHSDIAERLIGLEANVEFGGRTALMEACRWGHAETVTLLLDNGANPCAQTHLSQTTVMFAAETDSVLVMSTLHAALGRRLTGPSIREYFSQADQYGMTALLIACYKGNSHVAYHLLENCLSYNCLNASMAETGHTPFTLAASSGNIELISYLYRKGADPLHQLNDGSTALNEAAKSGKPNIIPLIYEHIYEYQTRRHEPPDSPSLSDEADDGTPYNLRKSRKALSDGLSSINNYANPLFESLFDTFQDNGTDQEMNSQCPDVADSLDSTFANLAEEIDFLGETGDICQLPSSFIRHCNRSCVNSSEWGQGRTPDIFGRLLHQRDKKGHTPLMSAALANNLEIIKELVYYGAALEDVTDRRDTALGLACAAGNVEVVTFLIQVGANVNHRNASNHTPLAIAASGGHIDAIMAIVGVGVDIDSRDALKCGGTTPCMLAVLGGHYDVVALLIEQNCDVNCYLESTRNSALTLACLHGKVELVDLLLRNGANVEHRSKNGYTPLMEAASFGLYKVAATLIKHGADVNAPPAPQNKETALTLSIDRGKMSLVELLLSNNAHIEVKNRRGCTALWLACNVGHVQIVQLLVNAGADVHACDPRGISCLHAAFRRGHVDVVKFLAEKVRQFPSNESCQRTLSAVTDQDTLARCGECMQIIVRAQQKQALEADRNADLLLQQIEDEKLETERKKEATVRRRSNKKRKKLDKQQPDEPQPKEETSEVHSVLSEHVPESVHPSVEEDDKVTEDELQSPPSEPLAPYNYQLPKITDFYPCPETKSSPVPSRVPSPAKVTPRIFKSTNRKATNFVYGEELTQEIGKNSRVIRVPSFLFGRIMGRGGAHMNKIREISLANIEVEQQKVGLEHRRIKIRGALKSMILAQQIISHIVTEQQQEVSDILRLYENEKSGVDQEGRSEHSEDVSVANEAVSEEETLMNFIFLEGDCYHGPIAPNTEKNTLILKQTTQSCVPTLQTFGKYTPSKRVGKHNDGSYRLMYPEMGHSSYHSNGHYMPLDSHYLPPHEHSPFPFDYHNESFRYFNGSHADSLRNGFCPRSVYDPSFFYPNYETDSSQFPFPPPEWRNSSIDRKNH